METSLKLNEPYGESHEYCEAVVSSLNINNAHQPGANSIVNADAPRMLSDHTFLVGRPLRLHRCRSLHVARSRQAGVRYSNVSSGIARTLETHIAELFYR